MNYDKQLQDYYSNKKQKGYYTTTEIMKMTGINERTLKYRIKEV